nr:MAG TPA: hypothetical protein [Bacteriophage sp.]
MIQFKTNLTKYNWNISVYIVLDKSDLYKIDNLLYKLPYYKNMMYRLTKFKNSGFSYSTPHNSIIAIGVQDSISDFIDTFNHEKNHIETYIGDYYDISYESEEFSILSGYLAKKLFSDLINQLILIK